MSLNQNLRRLVNLSTEFSFEGKVYKVKEATVKQRFAFATWVEMRAWEAIKRLRMNSDTVEDVLAVKGYVAGEIAAGKYEWGGEYVLSALQTMTGCQHLLYLMMRDENPGISEEIVKTVYEANLSEISEIMANSILDPKDLAEMMAYSTIGKRS